MLVEEFLEVVKSELPESKDIITRHTKFRELEEWDSLTGMSLIVLLEDEYNVSIPEKTFKTLDTFSDIFSFIENQKNM